MLSSEVASKLVRLTRSSHDIEVWSDKGHTSLFIQGVHD